MPKLPQELVLCQDQLGYVFKDTNLLINALTHSSVKNADAPSNERMEFLGDSILGMEASLFLYKLFPDKPEGELTRIKSVVVSRSVIGRVCREMDLAKYIRLGKGIDRNSIPVSLYANVFEALIAAIYMDGGIRPARAFIRKWLPDEVKTVLSNLHRRNYKSLLQQFVQRNLKLTPIYCVVSESGPDHKKRFEVCVKIGEKVFGNGIGQSKKEAEQDAARLTWETLQVEQKDKGVDLPESLE